MALVGCATIEIPDNDHGNVIPIVPKEAKIHGDVLLEGKIVSIAGIVSFGGAGYSQLLDEAKKRYGADAVVNVTLDKRLHFTLF